MNKIIFINTSRTPEPLLSHALSTLETRGFVFSHSIFSRAKTAVLVNTPEKVFLTPLAKLFGKRIIWLELPGNGNLPASGLMKLLYKKYKRTVETVVFSRREDSEKSRLEHHVLPAALPEPSTYQQDLFAVLADRPRRRFVAASIIRGLDKRLVERLLSALAATLPVCPIMELLIVGEGEDRKQLQWLVRRMGLTNRVWLVGDSTTPSRWLEDVNVYVVAEDNPRLEHIAGAVAAFRAGLPVLADLKSGLGNIVTSKTGALIDLSDVETVARQLVRLEQEVELCKDMGAEAREVSHNLTFERFTNDLATILLHGSI